MTHHEDDFSPSAKAKGGARPAKDGAADDSGGQSAAGDQSDPGSRAAGGTSASSIPEPLRRLLEVGLGRLGERPEMIKQRLSELRLPREAWAAILSQLDDRKSGLYRLIAKEVRELLESTNFAEELVKALTTLSFEMKTEIRFIPNDKGGARPNLRSAMRVKTADEDPPGAPARGQATRARGVEGTAAAESPSEKTSGRGAEGPPSDADPGSPSVARAAATARRAGSEYP